LSIILKKTQTNSFHYNNIELYEIK